MRRRAASDSLEAPPAVTVPVGFTTFPGEIWAPPRSWVEIVYPGLAYFHEADKGDGLAVIADACVGVLLLRRTNDGCESYHAG